MSIMTVVNTSMPRDRLLLTAGALGNTCHDIFVQHTEVPYMHVHGREGAVLL